jgi:hypothetical protein
MRTSRLTLGVGSSPTRRMISPSTTPDSRLGSDPNPIIGEYRCGQSEGIPKNEFHPLELTTPNLPAGDSNLKSTTTKPTYPITLRIAAQSQFLVGRSYTP